MHGAHRWRGEAAVSARPWLGVAAAALAVGLAACSGGAADDASGHAAAASGWLAVARGQVEVEGGMVQVVPLSGGVVVSVDAEQGQHVEAGQVLAQLDARAAAIGVEVATTNVAQARAGLAELQASLVQARWSADHLGAAAKEGTATGAAAVAAKATLASLEARQGAAQASLDASRHQLAQARLQLDEMTLHAPVAGTVATRDVAVGQAVGAAAGPPLFKLLPDRPYIVRAQVDAQAAIHLRPGMRAEVVRDSASEPVYQATVLRVGKILQAAVMEPSPLERALAEDVDCTLKLLPAKAGVPPLPIGQRVVVRFPRPQAGAPAAGGGHAGGIRVPQAGA